MLGVNIYELDERYRPMYVYQVKRHRKSRINKKWRKRYGFRSVPDRTQGDSILMTGNAVYCYSHVAKLIKELCDKMNRDFLASPPERTKWNDGLFDRLPDPEPIGRSPIVWRELYSPVIKPSPIIKWGV